MNTKIYTRGLKTNTDKEGLPPSVSAHSLKLPDAGIGLVTDLNVHISTVVDINHVVQ
jgi:hypothetical protein